MPTATASGSDPKSSGSARSRDHNQGNQDRKYTAEQKAEVLRVRRCSPTAFYDILGLEKVKKTATEAEIRKAYRRISLLTHPDKNGYEHADEAFKIVSRAFGVLSDKEKRALHDRSGGDPDSRFGGQQTSSPFSGFAGRTSGDGSRSGAHREELTPEEMFRRFFGGSTMGGFGGNPGFVFNMGGGPGIRVQPFGGATPRRRPRNANAQQEQPASLRQTIMGFLPLIIILVLPIFSSLISGFTSSPPGPTMRFDRPVQPHTLHRRTSNLKINYYIDPNEVQTFTPSKWNSLDKKAEINYVNRLNMDCQKEIQTKEDIINQAQGWFVTDPGKMLEAKNLPMAACKRLESLGMQRLS
ncbi:putative J domain-containing protein C17A3.05c [Golovinomyces cichoracearum]|uniref:Putative J domain-containing protein C17A3.05c n=1 Tax=Golovinomyces cichoracearum TaxID=62708 RepID=A0A420IBM4_9PEZI|nr:putative J domain-containing protein C17A3.05c [Golovinomyces cichoracearum]